MKIVNRFQRTAVEQWKMGSRLQLICGGRGEMFTREKGSENQPVAMALKAVFEITTTVLKMLFCPSAAP